MNTYLRTWHSDLKSPVLDWPLVWPLEGQRWDHLLVWHCREWRMCRLSLFVLLWQFVQSCGRSPPMRRGSQSLWQIWCLQHLFIVALFILDAQSNNFGKIREKIDKIFVHIETNWNKRNLLNIKLTLLGHKCILPRTYLFSTSPQGKTPSFLFKKFLWLLTWIKLTRNPWTNLLREWHIIRVLVDVLGACISI